ncbi:MAG: putative dual-specificity RNA methyltransferase RlmN [Parcubacteria group bacterium GW2011_GWC2_39_14]|nr:MAG: putative dual-specificity RNA methyltransferase RlmN [Parcubacteria group bacterium GW2011_GWC2_39_14]KKR54980.1 MAG: putative dual-specificity RNA methyltransferase RlmN [Parcubacteria group bacterium GW2011_GWA2_40_23]
MDFKKIDKILETAPSFRRAQVKRFIFKNLIEDWEEATSLSKDLRALMSSKFSLNIEHQRSESKENNTTKELITLEDGFQIETVLMRHEDGRNTVCVSSQVGCALGCDFCATGKLGFFRNLTANEIVMQVLLFNRLLKKEGKQVTNVVYMGMGEPMLNYENVINSIHFMNNKDVFGLGARKFSISTAGVVEGIKKLIKEPMEINLAVSIHAPNDKLRTALMPINKKWNLKQLFTAIDEYIAKTNRRVMLEYTLIKNVNDSLIEAAQLKELARNKLCFINLITYNKTKFYAPPSSAVVKRFADYLEKHRVAFTFRQRFGHDIAAACGQLARKKK